MLFGNTPIAIFQDLFLDKDISLEAKGLATILNTKAAENGDLEEYLSQFKIKNLEKLMDELEKNDYLIKTTVETKKGEQRTFLTLDGQKYSKKMKKSIKKKIENY